MNSTPIRHLLSAVALAGACLALSQCSSNGLLTNVNAANSNPRQIASDSRAALKTLYSQYPQARSLGNRASGILVFPTVTKGGFVVGGLGGNGALIDPDGKIRQFYQTGGLSYGLQAGVQQYKYALFLMDDAAIRQLKRSGGWEIGSAPSLVIVDQSMAASLSLTTLDKGTYAFLFHQRGLMGGLGLQGSKITRFYPGQ